MFRYKLLAMGFSTFGNYGDPSDGFTLTTAPGFI
jgi:prolyl oligopeptidase PreP (S9A serine peptidase family)